MNFMIPLFKIILLLPVQYVIHFRDYVSACSYAVYIFTFDDIAYRFRKFRKNDLALNVSTFNFLQN